ncbi:Hypothetical protein MYEA_5430 [Mycoplasma yeatsii 13926]|uniref:DUF2714 domain-containing protein n=1 Tax=Mycoplasma yeatsii 13926 TaxID=1188240 RepID=S6G3P6_9MOLU|nr:DUF2714 domain-containing protein [Mycoplasma yeatsii]EOA07082.1 Hypothetical protein MYEA_5430 [Mycoplasma yeatsii 13926]
MRKNDKNSIINLETFDVFDLFKKTKASQNYISYKKLIASVLLGSNLGFNSDQYLEFEEMTNKALENKFDLLLKDFVISFNVDHKYGLNILVPILTDKESTNNEAISFIKSSDEKLNNFLNVFNLYISKLINDDKCIEIFPEIIVYRSKNTTSLKILFNEKYLVIRGS